VRVAHIANFHQPLDVRIFQKECRTLAQAGYEVHLIIRDPEDSERDGVRFHALARNDERGKIGRIWSRLSGAYRIAKSLRADLYHFHEPELIVTGLLLRLGGAKVIYDVHEDAPEEAFSVTSGRVKGWIRSQMMRMLEGLARVFLTGFVCATPHIARRFPPKKTVTVRNLPLLSEFDDVGEVSPYESRPETMVYVGGIFAIKGVYELVQALEIVGKTRPVRLSLAGAFESPEFERALRQLPGWQYVDYLGWQSREEVARLLSESRLGAVTFQPKREYLVALPVKMFEYMAAGIPVVASDFALWREIVEATRCGRLADPSDPASLAQAILWLLDHPQEAAEMGRQGQRAVQNELNWETESQILLDFYQALLL
jgi:glycosyltransferase involved in cell wall biosynthesis